MTSAFTIGHPHLGQVSLCCAALFILLPLNAQLEKPLKWTAMSTTAMGVTGDIIETAHEFVIGNQHLKLTPVRRLENEELADAAELLNATLNPDTRGALYKTFLAPNTRLQGGNSICGRNATSWIVALRTTDNRGGINLDLAFFSGKLTPDLSPSAINASRELCGTYWYQK
jgi:hypothetical protein